MGSPSLTYLPGGNRCSSKREKSEPYAEMCTERRVPAAAAGAINWSFEASSSRKWENFLLAARNVIVLERSTKTWDAFSGCRPAAVLLRGTDAYSHVPPSLCEEKARQTQTSADGPAHAIRQRCDQAQPHRTPLFRTCITAGCAVPSGS
jgi:hypothetical protein